MQLWLELARFKYICANFVFCITCTFSMNRFPRLKTPLSSKLDKKRFVLGTRMGLADLDRAILSFPAVFLGIIVVSILYIDVYGIKKQQCISTEVY